MFYILETQQQLEWLEQQVDSPMYIEPIPTNFQYHPTKTTTVALYARFIGHDEGYIIPIHHEEGLNIGKQRVYDLLTKAPTLYTLDKKHLLYHFNLQQALDVSLIYSMTEFDRLEHKGGDSTVDWYYTKYGDKDDLNAIIPLAKLYERSENIFENIHEYIKQCKIPQGFEYYNNIATNVFYLIEQNGVGVIPEQFNELFTPRNPILNTTDSTVYTSYNLYNSTSRPTNNFNSVNFAAIPKTQEHRTSFKPQNDFFVEFDFDGYHLRLLAEQINYPLTEESAHKQLAKHYFGTEDITEEQYAQAKQINFQAIYGKIPEEHKNLEIFVQIQEYIDAMWSQFSEQGWVSNPQSGKTFTKQLKETHPAKLMNYMMQSLETSNNIAILKDVLKYLRDKKSFITLYVYDAIVFDFSKEDGKQTLEDIKAIMERGGRFPIKFKYNTNLLL